MRVLRKVMPRANIGLQRTTSAKGSARQAFRPAGLLLNPGRSVCWASPAGEVQSRDSGGRMEVKLTAVFRQVPEGYIGFPSRNFRAQTRRRRPWMKRGKTSRRPSRWCSRPTAPFLRSRSAETPSFASLFSFLEEVRSRPTSPDARLRTFPGGLAAHGLCQPRDEKIHRRSPSPRGQRMARRRSAVIWRFRNPSTPNTRVSGCRCAPPLTPRRSASERPIPDRC